MKKLNSLFYLFVLWSSVNFCSTLEANFAPCKNTKNVKKSVNWPFYTLDFENSRNAKENNTFTKRIIERSCQCFGNSMRKGQSQ